MHQRPLSHDVPVTRFIVACHNLVVEQVYINIVFGLWSMELKIHFRHFLSIERKSFLPLDGDAISKQSIFGKKPTIRPIRMSTI